MKIVVLNQRHNKYIGKINNLIRSKLERQNLDSLRHDTCHATWDQITQGTVSNKHLSKNNDGVKQKWRTMNMDEKNI